MGFGRGHLLDEPIPGFDCTCGVYGAKTIGVIVDGVLPLREGPFVIGIVLLWGRVVEHELGYRAAMASVGAFYRPIGSSETDRVTSESAQLAADVFDVPCIPCLPWKPWPSDSDDAA